MVASTIRTTAANTNLFRSSGVVSAFFLVAINSFVSFVGVLLRYLNNLLLQFRLYIPLVLELSSVHELRLFEMSLNAQDIVAVIFWPS